MYTLPQVLNRLLSVYKSCTNRKQYEIATKYASMLIDRFCAVNRVRKYGTKHTLLSEYDKLLIQKYYHLSIKQIARDNK